MTSAFTTACRITIDLRKRTIHRQRCFQKPSQVQYKPVTPDGQSKAPTMNRTGRSGVRTPVLKRWN